MCTFGTFVEDRRALVHAPQLHGVEVHLMVRALGAGLLDHRVLLALGLLVRLVFDQPGWLGRSSAAGDDLRDLHIDEFAAKQT